MSKYSPQLDLLIKQAKKLNIRFELIYKDDYDFYSRLSFGKKYIFIRQADLWRNINKMSGRFTDNNIFIKKVLSNNNLKLFKPSKKYFSLLLLNHKIIDHSEKGLSKNQEFEKIAKHVTKELNLDLAEIIFSAKGVIEINRGEAFLNYSTEAVQKILKKIFNIK